MGYLIVQMMVLLVAAVALGVLLGWMAFRWGRRVVGDEIWEAIADERAELRAEAERCAEELVRVRDQHGLLVEERARMTTELARVRPSAGPATATPAADSAASPWAGDPAGPTADELRELREAAARVPALESELARLMQERQLEER